MLRIAFRFYVSALLGVVVSLSSLSAQMPDGSPRPRLDFGVHSLLQGDTDGEAAQRLLLDIGPSRWLWIARSTIVMRDTAPKPFGRRGRDVSLRSPFTDAAHRFGLSLGPATVGSVTPRGVFRRLLDPAAGGIRWTALSERDGVRLDTALDRGRWTGGGLIAPARWPIRPAYVYLTDARPTEGGSTIAIHSGTVAVGRETSPIGTLSLAAYDARVPLRSDDSWLFEAPPLRRGRLRAAGLSVRRGRRTGDAWWTPSLTVEAWAQRAGDYRPSRRFVQAWWRFGGAALRVDGRVLRSDVGFYGADGRSPGLARMAGTTVSGRLHVAPKVRLRWSGELSRRTRWDDRRVGPGEYQGAATVRVERSHRLLRSVAVTAGHTRPAGDSPSHPASDADIRVRVAAGAISVSGRSGASTEGRRSGRVGVVWSRGATNGTAQVGLSVGALREESGASWEAETSTRLSVPIARRWRTELTVSVDTAEVESGRTPWSGIDGVVRLIGRV